MSEMSLCPKLHHMKTTETQEGGTVSCFLFFLRECTCVHTIPLPLSLNNVNKIIQVSILIPRENKHPSPVENIKNIQPLPSQNICL